MYTRFCAALSKLSLVLAVIGLIAVILCVQWQVIGRYIFNDTPTWAEALALLLDHWNDQCQPPWAPEELDTKVQNAYRYGQSPPGIAAPEAVFSPVPPPEGVEHPFTKLNKEFAFVLAGGGSHILWETTDEKGVPKLEHLAMSAFHNKFAAWKMQIGKRSTPVTELWMESAQRRSYDGIVFQPCKTPPARRASQRPGEKVRR